MASIGASSVTEWVSRIFRQTFCGIFHKFSKLNLSGFRPTNRLKFFFMALYVSPLHSIFSNHMPHVHVGTCTCLFMKACAPKTKKNLTSSIFVVEKSLVSWLDRDTWTLGPGTLQTGGESWWGRRRGLGRRPGPFTRPMCGAVGWPAQDSWQEEKPFSLLHSLS